VAKTKQKKDPEENEKATKPSRATKRPRAPRAAKAEPSNVETSEPSKPVEAPSRTEEAKAPEPPKSAEAEPRTGGNEKIVYVGQKPVMNYVMACMTAFNAGSYKIVLKARGRAICKAVDTAELLRRAFMKNAQLQGIIISTEEVAREGNRKSNVSTIEISVIKQ